MPSNRGVVYTGPGKVSVESIDYPELVLRPGRAFHRSTRTGPARTA